MNILSRLGFDRKTLIRFIIIVANSQIIYSFNAIREVLYNPYVDALGVSHAQFGVLMGIIGAMSTFGNVPLGWIQDRFSARKVLTVDTLIVGAVGLFIALTPTTNFALLLPCFIIIGLFTEPLYWATVLKSVRAVAKEDKQATAFGFLEFGRGLADFLQNGVCIILYTVLGSTFFGIKAAMVFNAAVTLVSALLVWFIVPEENLIQVKTGAGKTKIAFSGLIKALKMPEIWMTGIAASCVYATFTAVSTYFVPYLQSVYLLPAAMVGIFGLVNTSVVRFISGPVSGIFADQKFKTSAHWMRFCYIILAAMLAVSLLIPKTSTLVIPAMIVLMIISVFCYLVRGVYFAPIGESNVPAEMGAAAMSVASFIGYSPQLWGYTVFGAIIDHFDPTTAYMIIFALLVCLSLLGIFMTTLLGRRILKHRAQAETAQG
ncbi:MFS transporter [Butyricicoccus faecihominis]|uniref:MFS transporter n=1 Tax=Butyricicoccus faecihominis TaxID=1712515 RepID=UPI0024798EE9|nr:MFS transporter [Butyricicoccus faecihominis]MCQ5130814.1 MFS transporter [Butyricicoccus faecihominis]